MDNSNSVDYLIEDYDSEEFVDEESEFLENYEFDDYLKECHACFGTGMDRELDADCLVCWGDGCV